MSASKIVKFVQITPTYIHIPTLHFESLYQAIFDTCFNNLQNGESQGDFLILLSDKFNNIAPNTWSSTKLKRVVWSRLVAEVLSLSDASDIFFIALLAKEMIYPKRFRDINIQGYADNHSLHKTLNITINPW